MYKLLLNANQCTAISYRTFKCFIQTRFPEDGPWAETRGNLISNEGRY
jgi:hypothetical protein